MPASQENGGVSPARRADSRMVSPGCAPMLAACGAAAGWAQAATAAAAVLAEGEAVRSTDKPCLAFKILAAGRLCDQQELVEAAFQQAFGSMKPNDAVIVGMYPEYEDQVAINAGYVRRFAG